MARALRLPAIGSACAAATVAAIVLIALVKPAAAHAGKIVGDCEIVVGFVVEPPIEGQPNGVLVRVTRTNDGMSNMSGVAGMDKDEADMLGIDPTTTAAAGNTMTHGALVNQVMPAGSDFSFLLEHDLAGKMVPFHVHGGDFKVTVKVDVDAQTSGEFGLTITEGHVEPAVVTLRPGTTVKFANQTQGAVTLMSGMLDNGSPRPIGPVSGLDGRIHVEVTHLPTGAGREMELKEVTTRRGDYVADLIPMAGAYQIKVYGEVDGMAIDETFRSGPGSFDDVELATPPFFRSSDSIAETLTPGPNIAGDGSAVSTASPAVDPEVPGRRTDRLPPAAFGIIGAAIGLVVAASVVLTRYVRKRAA